MNCNVQCDTFIECIHCQEWWGGEMKAFMWVIYSLFEFVALRCLQGMCFSKKKSLILKQTSNLFFILDWLMRKPPSSKQDGGKRTRVAGQHFLQLHCRHHGRTSRRIFSSQYPPGLLQTLRSPRIAHSGNLQGEHVEEKGERGKMQLKLRSV